MVTSFFASLLHFTNKTLSFGGQSSSEHLSTTVGPCMTPGSLPGLHFSGNPDLDPEDPERSGNWINWTYQIIAHGVMARNFVDQSQNIWC